MKTNQDDSAPALRVCPQCGNATAARLCPIDGWETIPNARVGATPEAPTDVLGRWQASALITREGAVTFWGGRESAGGRAVRIAVVSVAPTADLADVARAQRAAKALEALGHPHIAKTLATGLDASGDLVIVTDAVSGPLLSETLAGGGLGLQRAARLGAQLFDALEAGHVAGVMHHDLSPDRIRLVRNGDVETIVIQDMGIADLARLTSGGRDVDPTQLRPGTARYRAPEQARDRAVTRHADLYAAGSILYEAIAGRPVFDERTAADYLVAHLVKQPARPRLDGRELAGPMIDLVLKCLEKKPWNRPESAAAARDILRQEAGDVPPPMPLVIVAKSLLPKSQATARPTTEPELATVINARIQEAPTQVSPPPMPAAALAQMPPRPPSQATTRPALSRHNGPVPAAPATSAPALGATPMSPPAEPTRLVRTASEPMTFIRKRPDRTWWWVAAAALLVGGAMLIWQLTESRTTPDPTAAVVAEQVATLAPPPPIAAPAAPPAPTPTTAPAPEPATAAPAATAAVEPANDEPLHLEPLVEDDAPPKPAKPPRDDSAEKVPTEKPPTPKPDEVRPANAPANPSAKLRAMIVTEPPGATVKVDGQPVGRTPMTVTWEDGEDPEIELSLVGYEPAALTLEQGSSNRMLKLKLIAAREPVKPAPDTPKPGDAAPGEPSEGTPATEPPADTGPRPSLLERGWRPR